VGASTVLAVACRVRRVRRCCDVALRRLADYSDTLCRLFPLKRDIEAAPSVEETKFDAPWRRPTGLVPSRNANISSSLKRLMYLRTHSAIGMKRSA
jgi:hypothetical protein